MGHSGFIEDNPEGTLSKAKMMKMYEAVLSQEKAKEFVEKIFNQFDSDNSGEIDFKAWYIQWFVFNQFLDFTFKYEISENVH